MSTNKSTPTREDLSSKRCLSPQNSRDSPSYTPMPFCILDISCGRALSSFEFVVSYKGSICVCDIDALRPEQRLWLLAKFKANLRKLSIIEGLKPWVSQRMRLLREYCDRNGLEFETLYIKSCMPPNPSTRLEQSCHQSYQAESCESLDTSVKADGKADKKKGSCLSDDDHQKSKKGKLVLSKAQKSNPLRRGLKTLIQKYTAQKSVDRETLLAELARLRPHIYDM